jgi:hypothetical protein
VLKKRVKEVRKNCPNSHNKRQILQNFIRHLKYKVIFYTISLVNRLTFICLHKTAHRSNAFQALDQLQSRFLGVKPFSMKDIQIVDRHTLLCISFFC